MSTNPNLRLPSFSKLQASITLALFKQQTAEPEYEALDSHTPASDRFSRLSEYASDVVRIFREMELAHSLIVRLPSDEFFTEHESTKEDYVMYHQGHFLDLVHQVKDKLTHLVDGLVHDLPFKEKEHADPIALADDERVKSIPDLSGLLKIWTQVLEAKHGIAVVLRRRTQYHHFRNRLHLTSEFQDIKLFRTMQQEAAQKMLSEEGKKLIEEKGAKGFDKWYSDVEKKMQNTIGDIQQNLEAVSVALTNNLSLPSLEKDGGQIFDDYFKMSESLKIKNIASADHYKKTAFYPIIKTFETILPPTFGENLLSLYLVGSTTRGDAVPGVSDVNFVLILQDDAEMLAPIVERLATNMSVKTGAHIEFTTRTATTFKAASSTLLRFLCKTDGLLLAGVDLVGDEKFPKPGLGLSCLFKQRIKEDIEAVKNELAKEASPTQEKVSKLGKVAAKVGLRLMFIAAMADTARYERSFEGMNKVILDKFPENKKVTDIFYGIATSDGTVDLENLRNLMSAFSSDSSLGKLLKQLDEKCEQLSSRKARK